MSLLARTNGPIWYRGYFKKDKLNQSQINDILKYFNVNHIVVGHTSQSTIVSLFNGKVIGIDASIKDGSYGEVLIYKDGELYRGTLGGKIIKI